MKNENAKYLANFLTDNGTYMEYPFESNCLSKLYHDIRRVAQGNSCGEEVRFWILDVKENTKYHYAISRDGKRAKKCGETQEMVW